MRAGSPIFSYQNYMTLYTKLSDALHRSRHPQNDNRTNKKRREKSAPPFAVPLPIRAQIAASSAANLFKSTCDLDLARTFDRFDATRKAGRGIPFPAGNKKAI